MPRAKASSVAAASHGSTASTNARKREGLARSVSGIAALVVRSLESFELPVPLIQSLAQRHRGRERADHDADQGQRAQNGERRAERDRPDNGGIGRGHSEDENGDGQRQ